MKDIFATANVVEKKTAKAKTKKAEVELSSDLTTLAAISTLMKSLEALKVTVEASVKLEVKNEFISLGFGKRPENFRGVSNNAEASCELRKRASTSALSLEEQELCALHAIGTENKSEDVYLFNPKLMKSQEAMKKISAALSRIDLTNILGEDSLVLKSTDERVIVTEDAVDQMFMIKSAVVREQLLPVVCTLALKPKLLTQDLKVAFQILEDAGINLN